MKILKNIFFVAIFALVASTTVNMRAAHEKSAAAIAQEEACNIVERLLVGKKIFLGNKKIDDILNSSSLKAELRLLLNQRDRDRVELQDLISSGRVEIKQCGLDSFGDVLTEDELNNAKDRTAALELDIHHASFVYAIDSGLDLD